MFNLNANVFVCEPVLNKFVFCLYYKVYSYLLYFSIYKARSIDLMMNMKPL
ncbi:hypothetical protein PSEUDO8Z_60084 [Pseudomonas sp. 8Z]|nr:hypothetical protein PSEUDO8Z_60084 [Pseudomonas sp. 8Z]